MTDAPEIVVARVRKNARELIRVTLGAYRGTPTCDVRVFVVADGSETPTRKGVTFKRALLPGVAAALAEAARLLERDAPAPDAKP